MSLKDDIIGEITKQNPWQEYTGPAGGQGWVNVITGEIRYQEGRPDPGEGVPDDYEGEIPDVGEQPDELEPYTEAEVDELEEGDGVTIEFQDEVIEGEVVGFEEGDEGIAAMVDHGDGVVPIGPYADAHDWDSELLGYSVENPPTEDGYAEGWAEPSDEFVSGQTVEVYDRAQGEYVQGEVVHTDEFGDGEKYIGVEPEDGDGVQYEFVDGEPTDSTDAVVTAAQALNLPEDMDAISPKQALNELQPGDTVLYDKPDETGLVEAEVQETPTPSDATDGGVEVEIEPEGDEYPTTTILEDDYDTLFEEPPDWVEPDDIPGLNLQEEPDLSMLDGEVVAFDHPVAGEVEGEAEYYEDGQGWGWLGVGEEDEAFDAITENPDHPYYAGETLDAAETPWVDFEDDLADDLKIGDSVVVDGEIQQVEQINPEGEIRIESGDWIMPDGADRMIDAAMFNEAIAPPPGEGWQSPYSIDSEGNVDHVEFNPGDHVYYYDEEAEEMVSEEVDTVEGEYVYTDEDAGETVDREQIQGFAATGNPLGEGMDPGAVGDNEVATIVYTDHETGDVVEEDVFVLDEPGMYDDEIQFMDSEGEIHTTDISGQEAIVQETDRFGSAEDVLDDDVQLDGMDTPTDELVDEMYSTVGPQDGHSNYLSKDMPISMLVQNLLFSKSDQQSIKGQMMTRFNPAEVEGFYSAIEDWKAGGSLSQGEQRLEAAFREAMDGESRIRGHGPDHPGPSPPDEWVKMAEVANQMSQRYYADHVYPNTGGSLTRDCAQTSCQSFLLDWAEDPDAGEYDVDGRMLNNFQLSAGTWNYWRVNPDEVPTENIGLLTDYMFNPMDRNANEDEIWVTADDLTVSPEEVAVGMDRTSSDPSGHFGGAISEWEPKQVEDVASTIADNYDTLTQDEQEAYRPDELSDAQVETFLEVAERAEQVGVNEHSVQQFAKTIATEAQARGLLAGEEDAYPEYINGVEDFVEEMEVTAYDHGEEFPADVLEVDEAAGEVLLANYDTGHEAWFDPGEIASIDYSPEAYGEVGEYLYEEEYGDWDALNEAQHVYYGYGSGGQQEGMITSIDDDTVEISHRETGKTDYFDRQEVEQGQVIPQNVVSGGGEFDAMEDPQDLEVGDTATIDTENGLQEGVFDGYDEATDTYDFELDNGNFVMVGPEDIQAPSEGSGDYDTQPIVDSSDLEPGDEILYESGFDDEPQTYTVEEVNESGSVATEEGMTIVPEAVSDAELVTSEGSDDITGPDDVEPGDTVMATPYNDEMEVAEMYEDPEYGTTGVVMEDGDILDFDQIEPVDDLNEEIDEILGDTMPDEDDEFDSGLNDLPQDPVSETVDEFDNIPTGTVGPGEWDDLPDNYEVELYDPDSGAAQTVYAEYVTETNGGEQGLVVNTGDGAKTVTEASDFEVRVPEDDEETDDGLPSHGETDLVASSPEYDQIDEGSLVTIDSNVYEVTDKPDTPTGYFQLNGDAGAMNVQEWEIDELVEESG